MDVCVEDRKFDIENWIVTKPNDPSLKIIESLSLAEGVSSHMRELYDNLRNIKGREIFGRKLFLSWGSKP